MPDDLTRGGDRKLPARPGDRVGHYEIESVLGRGGMGVVYLARDLTLPREVALKCPWPHLAGEPEIRLRFMREARATSQITHPGIVAIYEVFEHEHLPWLAMQRIHGRSLREELIERGPLPARDVLRYGCDLAAALEAAHAQGVLHRDLTPRNVLVTEDGRAMLTDFGLARTLAQPADPSQARTMSLELTRKDHVVGTPPYMSPEQILDRPLDGRSDLFCLGLLLYEMCTGRQAFAAAGLGATVDAILHLEPPPVRSRAPEIPAALDDVVQAAMAKDPARRYESAAALGNDLRAVQRHVEFESYAGEFPTGPQSAPFVRRKRRRRLAVFAALAGVALVALVVGWVFPDRHVPFEDPELEALLTAPGDQHASAISPDARWVSFLAGGVGQQHIYVKQSGGGEPVRVTTQPGNVISQLWSPDGRQIAYLLDQGQAPFLQFIPAFGGAPTASVELEPRFRDGRLLRWIDDVIWIDDGEDALLRWDLTTGSYEELLERGDPPGRRRRLDVSPDGKRVAYTMAEGERNGLWIAEIGGGEPLLLTPPGVSDYSPLWIGPGSRFLAFSSNRTGQIDLWMMKVPRGAARRLTLSVAVEQAGATAPDGSLMTFEELKESGDLWRLDPAGGRMSQLTADTLQDYWPSVARDGSTIVFQRRGPRLGTSTGILGSQILLGRIEGEEVRDLRPLAEYGGAARLSPDGAWAAWVQRGVAGYELWIEELESGHAWPAEAPYRVSWTHQFPRDWLSANLAWTRDGATLYFVSDGEGRQELRRIRPAERSGRTELIVAGAPGLDLRDLRLSEDGRHLAYTELDPWSTGRIELRVRDLATGTERVAHSGDTGAPQPFYCAGWLRGGESLLVLAGSANPDWSERLTVSELRPDGRLRAIGVLERAYGGTARLDVSRQVLYATAIDAATGAHNVFALDLDSGTSRRLTDNRLPGVTFEGLEPLSGGSLLFSRHQVNTDVWLIRDKRRSGVTTP